MTIRILRFARDDLRAGKNFYDRQKEGLGRYFVDALMSDIESLDIYGGIHQKTADYYRLLSKRFPYSIYYKVNEDSIRVFAVLDDRIDPKKIQKRLKETP